MKFNGTAGTPTSWSATSITVPVPSGATSGNVVVTVSGVASNGVNFTVTVGTITVAISPKRAGLTVTQTLSVTATTNDSAGVNWSASGGSFSAGSSLTGVAVTYTAPTTGGSYTITATSVTSITTSASITVYVSDLGGMSTYHNDLSRDGVNTQGICAEHLDSQYRDIRKAVLMHGGWCGVRTAVMGTERNDQREQTQRCGGSDGS